MEQIFSTKISEHEGHLFEIGLLAGSDSMKRWWRVEVRLLDSNGHPVEAEAIMLEEQFVEVAMADEAGIKAAHRLVEARMKVPGDP